MKLVHGDMYMAPISFEDGAPYAYVPKRIWWKPWRWNLQVLRYTTTKQGAIPIAARHMFYGVADVVYNLSKLEAIGLMKLYGVLNNFD